MNACNALARETGEARPGSSRRPASPVQGAGGARTQRGSALLLAMTILALVASLASAMVWQQERAIRVEAAERARAQAGWILAGAIDWARLLLREDKRSSGVDHLGEPWAVPLAEARLSSFLAADRDPTAEDLPKVFLSGAIEDLQSRFNVAALVGEQGEADPAQVAALQRLADLAGAPGDTAQRIADGLVAALTGDGPDAPLPPQRFEQLAWLGLDRTTLDRLAPYATLLPQATPVNVNTAAREVLVAAIDGLDLGSAERIVQRRANQPLRNLQELAAELPQGVQAEEARVAVGSSFFAVRARLRMDERVLEQLAIVERQGGGRGREVRVLWAERRSALDGATP